MKNTNSKHEHYMSLAIKEAKKGFSNTKPNPLVGALIVKDGVVLSKGYHKEYGKNHAEVNALEKINYNAKNASIYVTLEPCSHYGNTPPCVDSIIKAGIKEVIIPFKDPSKKVCGKGVEKLKANNIKVVSSVLANEAFEVNEDFLYYNITGKPLITLKWASSIDGKITSSPNTRKKLTNIISSEQVHLLRAKNHAILIGKNTLNIDDPLLSIRSKTINCNRVNHKVILANNCDFNLNAKVFKNNNNVSVIVPKTINSNKLTELEKLGVTVIKTQEVDNNNNIKPQEIINILAKNGITSLLVEGGSFVITNFFLNNIVDKIECFIAPLVIGGNCNSTNTVNLNNNFILKKVMNYENDIHMSFENTLYKEWKKEQILCLQEL